MNFVSRTIDAAIASAFPGWALRRQWARCRLDFMQRSLGAAPPDRNSAKSRRLKRGPIEEQRVSMVQARRQARELHRADPYAKGAINTLVSQMVGTGAVPVPTVALKAGGAPNERFNDQAEAAWEEWGQACDVEGRRSFSDIQQLLMREKLVAGEALLIFSTDPSRTGIQLALEVVPSERLDDGIDRELPSGGRVIQGIEFGADGKRAAYWIFPRHPTDFAGKSAKSVRVPADRVLHWYDEDEAGQTRGFTTFSTTAGVFEMMSQWLDWVLTKERVATAFALMLKQGIQSYGDPGQKETDPASGLMLDQIEGGMIFHGGPGDDISGVASGVQGQNVDQLAQIFLRMGARGLGLSYEALSQDFSKVTYLSARSGENQSRRLFEPQQVRMKSAVLCSVWKEWMRHAVLAKKVQIPGGTSFDAYCAHSWVFPGWDWIDPKVDISGDLLAVQAGFKSPIEVITKRGGKPWRVLREIAMFRDWTQELKLQLAMFGLPSGMAPAGAQGAAEPQPGADPADPADPAAQDAPAGAEAQLAPAGTEQGATDQTVRDLVDAYGIAVRAGVVTPQEEDEAHVRQRLGVPAPGAAVKAAWEEDGGARRPITLAPPGSADAATPAPAPAADPTAGGIDASQDQKA